MGTDLPRESEPSPQQGETLRFGYTPGYPEPPEKRSLASHIPGPVRNAPGAATHAVLGSARAVAAAPGRAARAVGGGFRAVGRSFARSARAAGGGVSRTAQAIGRGAGRVAGAVIGAPIWAARAVFGAASRTAASIAGAFGRAARGVGSGFSLCVGSIAGGSARVAGAIIGVAAWAARASFGTSGRAAGAIGRAGGLGVRQVAGVSQHLTGAVLRTVARATRDGRTVTARLALATGGAARIAVDAMGDISGRATRSGLQASARLVRSGQGAFPPFGPSMEGAYGRMAARARAASRRLGQSGRQASAHLARSGRDASVHLVHSGQSVARLVRSVRDVSRPPLRPPHAASLFGLGALIALLSGLVFGPWTQVRFARPDGATVERSALLGPRTEVALRGDPTAAAPVGAGPRSTIPGADDMLALLPSDAAVAAPAVPSRATQLAMAAPTKADSRQRPPTKAPAVSRCRAARSLSEKMVCSDRQLAQADRALKEAYRRALASGVPSSSLLDDQEEWLSVREDAARYSRNAVANVYDQRIRELNAIADPPH